jgi:ectoine hydroxylase-related dioxygenase (phytanoyl-CoA dioxygenase family)
MLSIEQIAAFQADGYVAPLPLLSPAEAARCRAEVERFIAAMGGKAASFALGPLRTKAHLRCPALFELVHRPGIVDAVSQLIGPDLLCRSVSVFMKEPGDPAFVPWHQDLAYWHLDPPDLVSAWVALTDSTPENGAVEMLAGSHRAPLLPHGPANEPASLLNNNQKITEGIDPARVRRLALEAGEMSIHHVRTAHGSPPNRSAARRIGIAIRYVAPHVRRTDGRRESALLVRGRDRHGNYEAEPGFRKPADAGVVAP